MDIRFLKKGIRVNGQYYPVHYSSARNNLQGNITVYLKTYDILPDEAYKELCVENRTDLMTDYFEKDRIRIGPDSPYFKIVEQLLVK